MDPHNSTTDTTAQEDAERDFLVLELERRIEILEGLEESTFGRFTVVDWVFCVIVFVILPHIALWMFL
jgi:hypothetical protein